MGSALIINSSISEVRVAVLEGNTPVELHVERRTDRGIVGNVYRGKVVRVLPGMQAAFVDIGEARSAFLYVNDAVLPAPGSATNGGSAPSDAAAAAVAAATSGSETPSAANTEMSSERITGGVNGPNGGHRGSRQVPVANIADVVSQGQDILVQVQKNPMGTKGARITRQVAIPGRYLVYTPYSDHIGVSQRITDEAERERLRGVIAKAGQSDGQEDASRSHTKATATQAATAEGMGGAIVRTVAEGESEAALLHELRMLRNLWQTIHKKGSRGSTKRMVYADLDLILRLTRDLFTEDVDRIVVDNKDDFGRVRELIESFDPTRVNCVQLHTHPSPVFDHFGIEIELNRALDRKVWLKSGGTIVIDQAEALTVIDVNSGRFVGKSSLEDTVTQINLEAVKEIAYQLRLRNIGGIVIIDFIDMAQPSNRERVLSALKEALTHDKARTSIVHMSDIGLVEMTRKRVRESLGQLLTEPCPDCQGRGFVKREETVASEILRRIELTLMRDPTPTLLVNMQQGVADTLYASMAAEIEAVEKKYKCRVVPIARDGYARDRFEIVGTRQGL